MGEVKDRKKEEVMKQALQLMLQLNEEQLTLTKGVMTGMMLENSLKKTEKVSQFPRGQSIEKNVQKQKAFAST